MSKGKMMMLFILSHIASNGVWFMLSQDFDRIGRALWIVPVVAIFILGVVALDKFSGWVQGNWEEKIPVPKSMNLDKKSNTKNQTETKGSTYNGA